MRTRRISGWLIAVALCAAVTGCAGALVHEERSAYSHMQVIDQGTKRSLRFVDQSELDVTETLMDLKEPHRLQHPYARTMMAGLLYRPEPASCLLVGLGGGALVHFLDRHFPGVRLDVVEIDPAIVRVARDWFGTPPGPRTRIIVADARDYVARAAERYDLILMDARLPQSELTDRTGHPLDLKTDTFYRSLHRRLAPGGVVMFNMIDGRDSAAYLAGIRAAFAATEVYRPAASANIVVVASPAGPLPPDEALRARARVLDARGGYGFSFERLLGERERRAP